MKKAIATPIGQETKYANLTTEEIAQREAEAAAYEAQQAATQWVRDREAAYLAKGWKTPFDVFDDMLKRGVQTVLDDRQAIKTKYPKGE